MENIQERRNLYKYSEAFEEGYMKVSDLHTIFYEVSGNKNGKPVIVFHGGPGGGSQPFYRGFFDSNEYMIVQLDQRGCGKSTPFACLEENTTQNIAEDAEKLRVHLKIEKWHIVFGGSWGSTISLYYSQKFPDVVKSLVLRGIFLLRKSELDFFYQEGTSWIFPDYFEELSNGLPEDQRNDILGNYYKGLTGNDEVLKKKLAKLWTTYEMKTCKLIPDIKTIEKGEQEDFSVAFARIETHYFVNKGFLNTENQLLDDCIKIQNIPTVIVQGRYDVVCPTKSAWELHKKLPNSTLEIIQDAGHSCSEPGIIDALVRATDKFKSIN